VAIAGALARELRPRDRVLLEGPLGAGKSTFARALLRALGVRQAPEGSPTFAIAHEYVARGGLEVVHLDLYRMRSEAELEHAGVHAYFWEREAVVLAEWVSLWPGLEEALEGAGGRAWRVQLGFVDGEPDRRSLEIRRP
jgi:tRNA threonylcarbamoyladenosine biosynthesis protein TsaE